MSPTLQNFVRPARASWRAAHYSPRPAVRWRRHPARDRDVGGKPTSLTHHVSTKKKLSFSTCFCMFTCMFTLGLGNPQTQWQLQ